MHRQKSQKGSYQIIIKPTRSWFSIDWQGLIHYQDLLWLFVKRDFVVRYKQTILGPLWFIIQPLLTTVVFTIVFGRIAKISTDKLPPFLFYLCGITIWGYFSRCVSTTANSLISHSHILQKVYFPRLIIPLAGIISNIFSFLIQLFIFLGFYIYFKYFTPIGNIIDPNPKTLIILPFIFLQTALFALGVGLWVCALTIKYRDLLVAIEFLLQLWMYATPVIYPVSTIPAHYRYLMVFNPMSAIVDLFRYSFFGTVALSIKYLWCSIALTILVLISGLIIFNKIEKTFVDTI